MNRIVITILFLCISLLSFSQKETTDFEMRISGKSVYPELILRIDNIEVELDSISVKKINPKWIKKIEVIKNEKNMNIYGNKDGVVFIYPKKRYRKKILNQFTTDLKDL